MPVDTATTEAAADRRWAAAVHRTPCPPVRDLIGSDDVAAAYAVASRNVARRLASGATRVGRKIGLTSEAVQRQLGVGTPDFGALLDDMVVRSAPARLSSPARSDPWPSSARATSSRRRSPASDPCV